MARTRYIKPGFFKNESLAENGPWKRILFAGLWVLADKAGRLEDRPKRIKPDVFPYDDEITSERIDQLLAELASGEDPFIVRYEANGKRLIQVVKWLGHQSPHRNEAESILPSHRTVKNTEQKSTSQPLDEVGTTKDVLEVSHSRNDASPNGEWGMGNGELETGNGEPASAVPPVWREPAPKPRTNIEPRRNHAKCYDAPLACKRGYCLPRFQGEQWESQLAAGQPEGYSAGAAVVARMNAIVESTPDGTEVPNTLPWWRAQWAAFRKRSSQASEGEDWFDECTRLHGGDCGGRFKHGLKMANQIAAFAESKKAVAS